MVPQPLCTSKSRDLTCRIEVLHSFHRCYDSSVPLDLRIPRQHPSGPLPGDNRSIPTSWTTPVLAPETTPNLPLAPACMAGFTSHLIRDRPTRRTHREVPRRARRARRCRRLGCPQPPGPSERPGPGRPAHRGDRRRAGAVHLRLRDLGPGHAQRPGQRRGPGPGQRPAARRHLSQPPRQAGRHGARRRPGLADLRLGPVQPADDAGRGLPGAAGHAGRDRHRRQRGLRPRRRPGRDRRRPRRHAARC